MHARTFLLFGLVFAVAAHALTIQQEASFWANSGETAAAIDFVGDKSIVLIRVNDVESGFIKNAGLGYVIVEDDAEIQRLIEQYQTFQFQNTNIISNIQLVKDKISSVVQQACVNKSCTGIEACAYGVQEYVLHKVNAWPFSLVYRARVDFPTEYSGYISLNSTYKSFGAAVANVKSSIDDMYNASKASDITQTFAGIEKARQALQVIRGNYTTIYNAYYNITYKYFPYAFWHAGIEYVCENKDNVTVQLDEVISLIPQSDFKDSQTLFTSISTTTKERASQVKSSRSFATQTEMVDLLRQKIANLTSQFSALGTTSLTALDNELKEVNASKNKVGFDQKYEALKNKTESYDKVYSQYNNSVKALNNATIQINAAAKKYGSNDDRVVEMQKTTQALRTSLKQSENAVKNGTLNAVLFESIAQNASVIALRAGKLGPKESQIDLVTIGGILVLLLAVIGAVWYFKKTRGGGQAPTPVDVRDLIKQAPQQPPQ